MRKTLGTALLLAVVYLLVNAAAPREVDWRVDTTPAYKGHSDHGDHVAVCVARYHPDVTRTVPITDQQIATLVKGDRCPG